jgi:hypothetical protein
MRGRSFSIALALPIGRARVFLGSPLIASPYARALETAGIIAEQLNVPITVDPLITERFSSLATSVHPWPSFVPGGRIWHSIICRIHGGPRRRKRRR